MTAPALAAETSPDTDTEVSVLVKADAVALPTEPEDLLGMLSAGLPTRSELRARLQNPIEVRFLASHRLNKENRRELRRSDPFRLLETFVVLTYRTSEEARSAAAALQADPDVEHAEVSRTGYFSATPDDRLFPYVSGLTSTLHRQWGLRALNLESAWDYVTGHAYVAVLDNGLYEPVSGQTHPDLQENFRKHFSSSFAGIGNPPTGATGLDERQFTNATEAGHGTLVAGIIGATTKPGNTTGVAGTCWNCSLMIGRVSATGPTYNTVADGIHGMIQRGAQVINLSLGLLTCPGFSDHS